MTVASLGKKMDALSIDCVIFGFSREIKVLLVKHAEGIGASRWALPGGWIHENESIDDAAYRILSLLTGVENIYLEQLRAFGDVHRFPSKRVITLAYYSLIKASDSNLEIGFIASDVQWFKLDQVPELPYDHQKILSFGFSQLQEKVKREPIGFNLLPEKFTLLQLQNLYESILNIRLDKPNFRRKILGMNLLIDCGEKEDNVSYRAARLYRFDKTVYAALSEDRFILDF